MNITTASPAEIDTEIARIEGEIASVVARIERARATSARAELEDLSGRLTTLVDEKTSYAEEYSRRGGWTRYYLVTNHNGHLHTTMACRNTYPTTSWYWVIGLSGATADEAVGQGGALSCLDCFPGHREVIESGRPCLIETPEHKVAREERETRTAQKAAQARTKGITNPDGTPLYEVSDAHDGGWRETDYVIKTEVAASRHAMQAAYDLRWYGADHPFAPAWTETVRRCLAALAHKRDTLVEAERAVLDTKVEAKCRRETR